MARGDTINAPFGLYMDDFVRDTFHLSAAEQMIYLRALTYIWHHGFIPANERQFGALTGANVLRKWREPVANVRSMLREHKTLPDSLTQTRVERDRQDYLQNRGKERERKARQREMSRGTPDGQPPDGNRPITSPITSPSPITNESTDVDSSESNNGYDWKHYAELNWPDFKAAYPARKGSQDWTKARDRFDKLIRDGTPPGQLIGCANIYRHECEQAESVGTEYVKAAVTWLNKSWRDYAQEESDAD